MAFTIPDFSHLVYVLCFSSSVMFQNYLTFRVPDDVGFRNAAYALNVNVPSSDWVPSSKQSNSLLIPFPSLVFQVHYSRYCL